uniref:Kinesin-like protein n=1 Tax=Moumouvirus sp. 'Monve' TaxID=1128131 RepID=H2EE11_9VIRU|nr:kinesin-like protein [Moumouvirus Monve]
MLSLFILNGSVQIILNFIKTLDPLMNPNNIYNTNIFSRYLDNVDTYYDSITNELEKRIDQITTEQNNYPVTYNYASNPIIQYNNYYTNIANTSSQIYIILSVMNNIGSKNILPLLNNIDNESGRLIDFINVLEPYFEPTYIRNKLISLSVPDNILKPDLVRILNDFMISIISDLQLSLQSVNMNNLFKQISSELESGNSKVANYIINTDMSTTSTLNLSPPRILSSPSITKNIIDSAGTFIQNEYEAQIQLSLNNNDPFPIFILFVADIYRTIFNPLRDNLRERMRNINNNINNTNVSDLDSLREYYREYFQTKKFNDALFAGNELSQIINKPTNNNNDVNIKYILISPQEYQNNRIIVDDINDTYSSITQNIKPNLYEFYESEHDNYLNLTNTEADLSRIIFNFRNNIQDKMITLRETTSIMNQVMFNNYFKQYAFINNSKLLQHVENIVDDYETILRLTEQKIQDIITKNNYHILTLSQINNYQAFKSSINKTINNRSIVSKFYRRMSFGLIEYYYDILDSIVTCLDSKSFEDMSDIEAYLYQYHYIQLKRCYNLFRWIRQDYQRSKQQSDEINISKLAPGEKYESILKYKIQTLRTTGDVNSVFLEFQGLRKYLDEYSAVAMDKVQLHLRINDFVSRSYNDELRSLALTSGRNVDFLLDVDPTSQEYTRRLETGKLIFINSNNGNNLKINFDLLERIYEFNNPGQRRNYSLYYGPTYRKMKPVANGIDFERIYNTKIFPDSDVISNYMSIAPNILNNKGTVIMTYGYSGVGKSASLFGRKMDLSRGVDSPSNGILQATMDQFTNVDIYFRVYEIYGLGTQYNYYWNPSEAGNYLCYPDFYQCIIHHVLDNTDPNVLRLSDQLVFTNRHDMLAYVMDLKDPARGTNFTINNIGDPNLSGKSRTQYNTYFSATNNMINSTYIKINENHYRNFTDFVDEVDRVRMTGVPIKKLFDHIIKQVKGTINNPISSRSILVYDFEINLDPNSINPIFVPFLIYDLPGKEDIAKTYVDTGITPSIQGPGLDKIELRRRVFKDIGATEWSQADSPGKERKSTYVLNPLLIPIYDNNSLIMSYILRSISSYGVTVPSPNHLDSTLERQIVTDILNFRVNNFGYSDVEGTYFTPNIYPISTFYQNPTNITTFGQLLSSNEFKPEYYTTTGTNIDTILARRLGIASVNVILGQAIDRLAILSEVLVSVCVVVIGFLIQYKLFDIIVEIINQIVEGPGGSDNDDDGGWSRSKIYAFYEAYYINENVVGLLQYLITSVLNKSSDIQEQKSTINNETITDTISNNYRTANRYRAVHTLNSQNPNAPIYGEYKLIVNPQLLTSDDPLKTNEIENFILENDIDRTSGQFADPNTITSNADRKMRNVISFENRGDYDTNKIFRSGKTNYICNDPGNPNDKFIINPIHAFNTTQAALLQETNRPLLQDFIEPYEQKISFYYVFYVVSNSQSLRKAEEQIKLLNNTMPFINKMDPSSKKKQCV